jgi:hypothetical protein
MGASGSTSTPTDMSSGSASTSTPMATTSTK